MPVEVVMIGPHQHRKYEIGLCRLDFTNCRTEVRNVERKKIRRDDLSAAFQGEFLDPVGGDLSIVVVGSNDVDLLSPILQAVPTSVKSRV